MRTVRIASTSVNQTPLAWDSNVDNILACIEDYRKNFGDQGIILFPELCITGYGCEDMFLSLDLHKQAQSCLTKIVEKLRFSDLIVSVGLPILYNGAVYNCAALIAKGKVQGLIAKQHLAGDGIHYEPRWFKPWPKDVQVDYNGTPLGDIYFKFNQMKIGYEICEDAWVADRPGIELARKNVNIILNPSASHFAFGKYKTRKQLIQEGSRAYNCTYVYANLLGNEAGRVIYDGGSLVAHRGQLLATTGRFSYRDYEYCTACVNIEETAITNLASFKPAFDNKNEIAIVDHQCRGAISNKDNQIKDDAWENDSPANLKMMEFSSAVALGLFDYLRKSKSQGFVLSLSGGADSTACALLVNMMCMQALQTYGLEGLKTKLPFLKDKDIQVLTQELLTCVYQASKNSSDITKNAAQAVAKDIGATYYEFDIELLVEQYTKMVEKSLGRELSWNTDDIALQNIQARVRSPGVWMITNIKNALLLATSNRSEAGVGYATMDGDTSGSIAPIAGVDKAFIRDWLKAQVGMYPAVQLVVDQQPTAELRPQENNQTDEKDLMPYDILVLIEGLAIRDKLSPTDCLLKLNEMVGKTHDTKTLLGWVSKFFRLWARNQWKRERFAPSFHLENFSFDSRGFCRFPILSSGFEKELARLEDHYDTFLDRKGKEF